MNQSDSWLIYRIGFFAVKQPEIHIFLWKKQFFDTRKWKNYLQKSLSDNVGAFFWGQKSIFLTSQRRKSMARCLKICSYSQECGQLCFISWSLDQKSGLLVNYFKTQLWNDILMRLFYGKTTYSVIKQVDRVWIDCVIPKCLVFICKAHGCFFLKNIVLLILYMVFGCCAVL